MKYWYGDSFAGLKTQTLSYRRFLLLSFSLFLFTACGGSGPEPTPDVEATVVARLTETAADANAQAENTEADPSETPDAPPLSTTCRILTNALNLRSGPGEIFPPLTVLQQDAEVTPQNISPDRNFMLVQTSNGVEGWVSTRTDLVDCPFALDGLAVDAGPPTPTPTNTPSTPPTPTPTPTQAVAVVIPRAGGGDGDLEGDVLTLPELFIGTVNHPIFRDRIMYQLEVRYPDAPPEDVKAGIAAVDIEIVKRDDSGDTVYSTSLSDPPYCAFGGGTPCNILPLASNQRWPGTNQPIETGEYDIFFNVIPSSDEADGGNWRIEFSIWLPGDPPPPIAQLQARYVEVWRGVGELVFQVEAWDPLAGTRDGAGIANVLHRIIGPNGRIVYEKVETDPAYCAFGGDAPCPAYSPAGQGNRWPNGGQAQSGTHRLVAIVNAGDGRTRTFEESIELNLDETYPTMPASTPVSEATPEVTPTNTPTPMPATGELYAEVAQIGDTRGLIFRVVAWDSAVGESDGAGIQQVNMYLFGPDGTLIHERTEQGAPYCLFSNPSNSSTCNVWTFAQNNFYWPNGDPIQDGDYRLRADVIADSGESTTLDLRIQLESN